MAKYLARAEVLGSMSKRARLVVEHIMREGFVTTEQLKDMGYQHPPRAARDVREAGIPLVTGRAKSSDGRNIAAYRFGDLSKIEKSKLQGRQVLPKALKSALYAANKGRCYVCYGAFEERYLQVDHRVPYEVAGDDNSAEKDPEDFMLLCASCNRAKSWSCEQCSNWLGDKLSVLCNACYWGSPEDYRHVALSDIRRADIVWAGEETSEYDAQLSLCRESRTPFPDYVKRILASYAKNK